MTDKQIIIDEQMENLNNLATQQLKRIEEEKRQIEHIAKTHLVETFDMQREIDKLKAENDELKKQHEADKGLITSAGKMNYQLIQEYDKLKTENEELKKEVDDLLHKSEIQDKILWKIDNKELLLSKDTWIYKLEQTLTEIKEIVEKEVNNRMLFADKESFCDFNKILQKISEVEDE